MLLCLHETSKSYIYEVQCVSSMTELFLSHFQVHEMNAAKPRFLVNSTFDSTLAPLKPIWCPGEKLMCAGITCHFQWWNKTNKQPFLPVQLASVCVPIIHETLAASHGCLSSTAALDKCCMTTDQWTCRSNCFPHCTPPRHRRGTLEVHGSHRGSSQLWFCAEILLLKAAKSAALGQVLPDRWMQTNIFAPCSCFWLPRALSLSLSPSFTLPPPHPSLSRLPSKYKWHIM